MRLDAELPSNRSVLRDENLDVGGTSHDQEGLEAQGFPLIPGGGGVLIVSPL